MLFLCASLSACPALNQGAGRAADNAAGALNSFGKNIWKSGNRTSTRTETEDGKETVSRPVRSRPAVGAVSTGSTSARTEAPAKPQDEEDPREEESTLGGMERPGAR
jgi:hypothetical protein